MWFFLLLFTDWFWRLKRRERTRPVKEGTHLSIRRRNYYYYYYALLNTNSVSNLNFVRGQSVPTSTMLVVFSLSLFFSFSK